MVRALLLALLAVFPHFPRRAAILERFDAIAEAAERSSEAHGVPPAVLLSVAFHETHLGTDPSEGGGWGAPISRARRHVAGSPDDAARALASGFRVCGSWRGAVARFRSGLCVTRRGEVAAYVSSVFRLVDRMHARTR